MVTCYPCHNRARSHVSAHQTCRTHETRLCPVEIRAILLVCCADEVILVYNLNVIKNVIVLFNSFCVQICNKHLDVQYRDMTIVKYKTIKTYKQRASINHVDTCQGLQTLLSIVFRFSILLLKLFKNSWPGHSNGD